MENLAHMLLEIPPVSRCWAICIVATTLAAKFNLVSRHKLVFGPERAFSDQPWRLFTSFCYFGEPSIMVILAIWTAIRWSRTIEESFRTPMGLLPPRINKFSDHQLDQLAKALDRFKAADYFYFLLLVSVSIISFSMLGMYFFPRTIPLLGYLLHDILTYIACRLNPNILVNFFGVFTVQGINVSILTVLSGWVFQPEFLINVVNLLHGDIHSLGNILMSPPAWRTLLCLSLGHLWWFAMFYLFDKFYVDTNPLRLKMTTRTIKRVHQQAQLGEVDHIKHWFKLILLPPWYWAIVLNIEHGRGRYGG